MARCRGPWGLGGWGFLWGGLAGFGIVFGVFFDGGLEEFTESFSFVSFFGPVSDFAEELVEAFVFFLFLPCFFEGGASESKSGDPVLSVDPGEGAGEGEEDSEEGVAGSVAEDGEGDDKDGKPLEFEREDAPEHDGLLGGSGGVEDGEEGEGESGAHEDSDGGEGGERGEGDESMDEGGGEEVDDEADFSDGRLEGVADEEEPKEREEEEEEFSAVAGEGEGVEGGGPGGGEAKDGDVAEGVAESREPVEDEGGGEGDDEPDGGGVSRSGGWLDAVAEAHVLVILSGFFGGPGGWGCENGLMFREWIGKMRFSQGPLGLPGLEVRRA